MWYRCADIRNTEKKILPASYTSRGLNHPWRYPFVMYVILYKLVQTNQTKLATEMGHRSYSSRTWANICQKPGAILCGVFYPQLEFLSWLRNIPNIIMSICLHLPRAWRNYLWCGLSTAWVPSLANAPNIIMSICRSEAQVLLLCTSRFWSLKTSRWTLLDSFLGDGTTIPRRNIYTIIIWNNPYSELRWSECKSSGFNFS